MGLFDKIKDLFTDEEEVYETMEVETPPVEDKLPTFMRNKIEKEEQEKKQNEESEVVIREIVPPVEKKVNTLSFDFNDEDFVDTSNLSRSNVKKEKNKVIEKPVEVVETPVVKPYSNKKELDKPKKFKPTPVISPVYGILDKNYKTEEVVSKDEDSYTIQRASKKVDFESVRKKAYGTLSDDIKANLICENCEYLREVKVNKKIEKLSEEDLMYNMTVTDKEEKVEKKEMTFGEAEEYYDDFGKEYELPQRSKKNDEVKIVNHTDEDLIAEKVEIKDTMDKDIVKEEKDNTTEEVLEKDSKKDLELTDDLFNLIDSMYKERND